MENAGSFETPKLSRRDFVKCGIAAAGSIVGAHPLLRGVEAETPRDHRELPPFPEFAAPEYDQKVLTVMFRNDNDAIPAIAKGEELQKTFAAVSRFYDEISYGKVRFTFHAPIPWLSTDKVIDHKNYEHIAAIGNEILEPSSRVTDIDQYLTRMYIVPANSFRDFQGIGIPRDEGGFDYKRVWIYAENGFNDPNDLRMTFPLNRTIEHEIGHTLGLEHQAALFPNNPGDYRTVSVSGEGGMHFDVTQRIELGWISRDQVLDVTESGRYIIAINNSREKETPIALRLQKPDTNERYYVEYEKYQPPNGDDAHHNMPVHVWGETSTTRSDSLAYRTGTSEDFEDRINGVSIKKVAVENDTMVLDVQLRD